MKVVLYKFEVLELLKEHKENHVKEFENQMNGWKQKMDEYTKEMSVWANAGGNSKERPKEPEKPVDYTNEYNKLIEMVEYHKQEQIILDEEDFRHIVKDKFGWSGHFLSNSAIYSNI